MTGPGSADAVVLGCGHMGSALAAALAAAGHRVVVWNRTPAKALALQSSLTAVAPTLPAAIEAAPLVVVCVTSYADAQSLLSQAPLAAGQTVLNLTTGEPRQATELGESVTSRAASYLDGAILAYPDDIAASRGQIVVSGAHATFARHRSVLTALAAEVLYVSPDVSTANVLDVGIAGAYIPALTAFVEAASYLAARGVPVESSLAVARPLLGLLVEQVDEVFRAIDSGSLDAQGTTVGVYADAARGFLQEMATAGQRALLLEAASAVLDRAEAVGLGHLHVAALSTLATN